MDFGFNMDAQTMFLCFNGLKVHYKDEYEGFLVGYSGDYIIMGFTNDDGCISHFTEGKVTLCKNVYSVCESFRFAKPQYVTIKDIPLNDIDIEHLEFMANPYLMSDANGPERVGAFQEGFNAAVQLIMPPLIKQLKMIAESKASECDIMQYES